MSNSARYVSHRVMPLMFSAVSFVAFLFLVCLVPAALAEQIPVDNGDGLGEIMDEYSESVVHSHRYLPWRAEVQWCPQTMPGTLCSDVKPFCEPFCSNLPYCIPDCYTTEAGPAWAGGGQSQNDLLFCPYAEYANCHFSGPPYATGTDPSNVALPCEVQPGTTVANCTCEVVRGPNWVNLTAIMNLGAYYETIAACGEDGSNCVNMSTCPTGQEEACYTGTIAPVCKYVAYQDSRFPHLSLIPGADLISTYGLTMNSHYQTTDTTSCSNDYVAGCMTAPCYYTDDSQEYAQCECPITFSESFQLSQGGVDCDLPAGYVWE
ncbi:hypothetical protein [Rhabdochromatium marinum]|uniref:hypothetical protein n=1 Tax=Rhabdochromatium marinum TaxID=48729 RepID=UPI0019065655|nr:hypothetical protein [Rhabdochromatium marinum]